MTDFMRGLVERCADDRGREGLMTQLAFYLVRSAGLDRARVLTAVELGLGRAGQSETPYLRTYGQQLRGDPPTAYERLREENARLERKIAELEAMGSVGLLDAEPPDALGVAEGAASVARDGARARDPEGREADGGTTAMTTKPTPYQEARERLSELREITDDERGEIGGEE